MNIEIIPAVLPKSVQELRDKLELLKESLLNLKTEKPMVQIDICQSNFHSFIENIERIKEYQKILNIELEIMCKNSEEIRKQLNGRNNSELVIKRII